MMPDPKEERPCAPASPILPPPIKVAYADPPYLGCALKFYGDHPEAAVYDTLDGHRRLIGRLCDGFPDGWAYSLSSATLRDILPLCPDDARIGAWVKPFHAYKKGVRPAYAWEPVIYRGGRQNAPPPIKGGKANTPKDFVSCNITLRKGVTGAKPFGFCLWLIALLGLTPNDDLTDIFPGSNILGSVWNWYLTHPELDYANLHRGGVV